MRNYVLPCLFSCGVFIHFMQLNEVAWGSSEDMANPMLLLKYYFYITSSLTRNRNYGWGKGEPPTRPFHLHIWKLFCREEGASTRAQT